MSVSSRRNRLLMISGALSSHIQYVAVPWRIQRADNYRIFLPHELGIVCSLSSLNRWKKTMDDREKAKLFFSAKVSWQKQMVGDSFFSCRGLMESHFSKKGIV